MASCWWGWPGRGSCVGFRAVRIRDSLTVVAAAVRNVLGTFSSRNVGVPWVYARMSWSLVLQAGFSCSCLWQWEVAESCPSAAASWQPGSFALGPLVLSDWGSSTALKCRDCGFQVEHCLDHGFGCGIWFSFCSLMGRFACEPLGTGHCRGCPGNCFLCHAAAALSSSELEARLWQELGWGSSCCCFRRGWCNRKWWLSSPSRQGNPCGAGGLLLWPGLCFCWVSPQAAAPLMQQEWPPGLSGRAGALQLLGQREHSLSCSS